MFSDLDASLKNILTVGAAPARLRTADIAFDPPDKDYKPTQPTLNLFLYEIGENRELRDPTHHLSPSINGYVSIRPPFRVDCAYRVTSWSTKTGAVKTAEEHELLAVALTWLARFAVIDESFLSGALKSPRQPYPVTTTVAQVRDGENLGHFWSALGTPPRACFSLTATVAVQPFDEVETFPHVEEIGPEDSRPRVRIQHSSLTEPALAGRVLDHTLAGVSGVTVLDLASGATATTEINGRYVITGLEFGDHLLRVSVPGRADLEHPAHYTAHDQIHNIILPNP
jgi:hypothetical protein